MLKVTNADEGTQITKYCEILCSGIERLRIIKMSILPKLIYWFNIISV